MPVIQTVAFASLEAGTQAATVAVPALGGIGELLAAVIALCNTFPQNRYMSSFRNEITR